MLKEFKISSHQMWASTHPFGGGHTIETDPTRRGWRIKSQGQVAIVGRFGQKGCMSVVTVSGGYDVGTYEDLAPEELSKLFYSGEQVIADGYRTVSEHSGWALPFIHELESDK